MSAHALLRMHISWVCTYTYVQCHAYNVMYVLVQYSRTENIIFALPAAAGERASSGVFKKTNITFKAERSGQ